eukprot:m.735240 g.735240  ORF g.735240 m.735240 type:complete len:568 (-) comp58890_c0_seq2:114-1817(-)
MQQRRKSLQERGKVHPWRREMLLAAAVVALAACACAARVPLEPLQSRVPPAQWVRQAAGNADIPLIFALKHENLDQLEELFWRVSTPGNPEYGAHLSLAAIDALVQPAPARAAALYAWLASHSVTACVQTASAAFVTCTMPVAVANRLLDVTFNAYTFETTTVYRTEDMYTVPEEIAQHLDFVGNVHRFPQTMQTVSMRLPANDKPATAGAATTVPPHIGITPAVLRAHYNISSTVGTQASNQQAVAQFLGQYFHPGDLTTFWEYFGATFPHLDEVTKYIGPDGFSSGVEACLDVEYIMSTGANISTWFWSTGGTFEGQEPFLTWIQDVSNTTDAPFVHSVSYGDVESSLDPTFMQRVNAEFQIMGTRGFSILFASGDSGAGCNKSIFVPNFPASSPYVTTVGGTILTDLDHGEEGNFISGGGFSNVFARPSYQEAAVAQFLNTSHNLPAPNKYNHTGRGYPDIAAASSGFTVVVDDIPMPGVAGTSCAAPTSSGIVSLLNDIRIAAGQGTLGFLNPLLYQNPSALRDITEGCNAGCGENGAFCSQVGWDAVTGLGSPNFEGLKQIV